MKKKIQQYIPILEWLPNYKKSYLQGDIIAGLTVGVMLIPQGMAYGLLAGLDPIYGLYAGIVPLLLYSFFGTSRQLSVGPTALVSLLIISGVGDLAEPGSDLFVTLVISTALIAGIIQVILGLVKGGFLINFLSHPVISGFTSAAAVIIALSQLRNLFGIEMPRSNLIYTILGSFFQKIGDIQLPTLAVGLGAILLILLLKRIRKSLPAALITMIVGIVIAQYFGLEENGVKVVGTIPQALPGLVLPAFDIPTIQKMMPLALTICLISFIESLAIAKTIEAKHKDYRVIPNQELLALGLTKIGGAFFQSYPTTGSFTRSAINNDAGAKTGISSIVAAIVISLTLLYLTPLFYSLPQAVLAAIIVVAVKKLIDVKGAIALWKKDKRDFLTLIVTFLATLLLGIQPGVFTGILLSIGQIIYQTSRPHIAILGQLPQTRVYRNVARYEEAIQREDILIYRFDDRLYFGNAAIFRETIESLVGDAVPKLKLFILDASSIPSIDSTGIHELDDLMDFLRNRQVRFYIVGLRGPVRDTLERFHLTEEIGAKSFFFHIHDAVEYYSSSDDDADQYWTNRALQNNVKP